MSKQLEQLLASVKNTPELGKLPASVKESVRINLMAEIEKTSAPASAPTFIDVLRAPFHGIELRSVLQPVTALGVLVFASFGWVGSVFASMNSVPGDSLYGLKIAAERAQLSFAGSDDTRARLHIEFANRRADEVSRLLESHVSSNDQRVKEAMGNLKTEVQNVSQHLSNMETADSETAVSLAKLVDRKVGGLEQAINSSLDGATDSVKQEATEVKDAVKIASVQALSMIVKEDGATPAAAESLSKKVGDRVAEVKADISATQKELTAVELAFAKRAARLPIISEADREDAAALKVMKVSLAVADESLDNTVDALEKKEYTSVMKTAQEASDAQKKVSDGLTELKTHLAPEPEKVPEKSDEKQSEPVNQDQSSAPPKAEVIQ